MLTENVKGSISELEREFLYENAILARRRKKPDDSPFGLLEPVYDVYNNQESHLANKSDGPSVRLQTLHSILDQQRPRVSISGLKQNHYESVENYLKMYKALYTYVLEDLDADWLEKFPKSSKKNGIKNVLSTVSLRSIQETEKEQTNINKPLLCKFRRINVMTRYASRINKFLEDFEWVDDVNQYKELTTLQFKEMQVLDKL